MRTSQVRFTRLCVGVVAALTLAACGGGSDDSGNSDDAETADEQSGDSDSGSSDDGAVAPISGTIDLLVGDGSTSFTIMLPTGFAEVEPISATSPRFEDPSLDFGERNTRVELVYLPQTQNAQGLIDDWLAVNSTITVIDQADEDGLSWFTYSTPSSTTEGQISFGTATTALPLGDGTSLQCRALTQNGIGEEWTEADAAAIAAANLETCRSLMAS